MDSKDGDSKPARKPRKGTPRPTAGRRARFTKEQVADALREGIFQVDAARLLAKKTHRPCARSTICAYMDRHPELRAIYDEGLESMKDEAMGQLRKNIRRGKEASLIFFLKTMCKDRGFTERLDVNHGGETVLEIRYPSGWGKDGQGDGQEEGQDAGG
jgi:hypothetical protein